VRDVDRAEGWYQKLFGFPWKEDDKSIYFRDPDNHLVELITSEHWISQL
jgi:hypothetical protein